jgi:signal transduction histidine kinase
MSLLLRPTPPPLGLGILTSGAFITAETLVAYPLRSVAPEASLAVLYLLGVLVVSLVWGLALGAATSLVSVVTFDFFHVPPTESFVPAADKDWVALAILLAVALLLSSIADLARTRAIEADERREEADLAAEMGRVLLSADDLRSALRAASGRLAQTLGLPGAAIELEEVPGNDRHVAFPLRDGATPLGTLVVGAELPRRTEQRLRERVVGSVQALVRAAREREVLSSELEASRDELGLLAQEQAALRRVATLVARAVPASEIFEAVAAEVAGLLAADSASLVRFEGDDRATIVAHRSEIGLELPFAGRVPDDSRSVLRTALSTRRAARVEGYGHLSGPAATQARKLGIRCAVGAPIIVEDRVWGAIIATWVRPELPPADTEARMAEFTELVATAIANAESRAELAASRARVVATADATRRRIERDLHDGTQQRLVSLGLQLRAVQDSVPAELVELRAELDRTARGLTGVVDELVEISRGIHPAILAKGGLGPALRTLARRSAIPVELDVRTERRLPGPVEVAAYYVVCEALTNAAKHARASVVQVDVEAVDSIVQLTIRDDGVGGADPGHGSGLIGLRDRLEALGGNIEVTSPAGGGTLLRARIPINGA